MPGSGQTLVALGLMRALRQRNLRVQSFKCGPELADLRYHALAADRRRVRGRRTGRFVRRIPKNAGK